MNPTSRQCADNKTDRETGAHWERQFCALAADFGLLFTPHQIGRPSQSAAAYGRGPGGWKTLLLPDVTVWSAPGEHHEIKHKNQTPNGMYGLEVYRLDALVRFANTTGQSVYYTIHDWEMAGARSSTERVGNDLRHWFVGDIAELSQRSTTTKRGWSYVNGQRKEVDIRYWTARRYFRPLGEVWAAASRAA